MIVPGRDGKYLMEKSKWPALILLVEKNILAEEMIEGLSQEDSLIPQCEVIGVLDSCVSSRRGVNFNLVP
jgi:hypothetical protein